MQYHYGNKHNGNLQDYLLYISLFYLIKMGMLLIFLSDMRIDQSLDIIMMENIQQKSSTNPPKYHPFNIPPSIQICYLHRDCSQFGKIVQEMSEKECPCCNSSPRQTLGIGCKTSQIYQISESVGYYFTYIKLAAFLLVIIMLVTGVYSLIQIFNQCAKYEDQGLCLYVYGIPIPKIHVFFKIPLIILNGVVIIVLYIFATFLFFQHAYLEQKSMSGRVKSSDFSILLTGVDHKEIKVEHLKEYLEEYQIKDIVLTHKIQKYMKWLSEKSLLDAQLQRYYHRRNMKKVAKIQQKLRELESLMLHTKNKLSLGQDTEFRTDKIILTFEYAHHKQAFQQLYKLTMSQNIYHTFCGGSPLMVNQHPIFIQPLGEPYQIIWQNFEYTSKSRYLRVFISNMVTIVLLFASFVMIVFLSKGEKDQDEIGDIFMSLFFAALIEIVNEALTFAIDWFTKWQRRYTLTGEISMKIYKYCAAFFLNSTLLPFLLFVLDFFQPEQDDIIRNILSVFFISNLISPYVGLYLNPRYLFKLYQRKKILNQESESLATQIKANKVFEKIDFMLNERFVIVAKLYMNCMFYAAIFPIGIIITFIGMIITYWSSKWWILNYCSLPRFSFKLGRHINIISCLFPTIYALGYAANLYMVGKAQFNRSYSIYIFIATIPITILFILFGQTIAKSCVLKKQKPTRESLTKQKFLISYKKMNPTSFIHSSLVTYTVAGPEDIWANLVSYATAKESGILNDIWDQRSNRSSKLSLTESINKSQCKQ